MLIVLCTILLKERKALRVLVLLSMEVLTVLDGSEQCVVSAQYHGTCTMCS